MDVHNIARMCHEATRLYCEINAATMDALPPWAMAPEWQQESCIAGVRAVIADPSITPEGTHGLWCERKLNDGWTYGTTKDEQAKTHPCLVPYFELPELQRAKDVLFVNIVRALMDPPAKRVAPRTYGEVKGTEADPFTLGADGFLTHVDGLAVTPGQLPPADNAVIVSMRNMSNAEILANGSDVRHAEYAAAQAYAGEDFDPSAPVIVACAPPVEVGEIYETTGDDAGASKEASDGEGHAEVVKQSEPAQAHGDGQKGSEVQGRKVGKKARH